MKRVAHFCIVGMVLCVLTLMGPRVPRRAAAQSIYVEETNTSLQCQSLQPITQPIWMGSTATISATYWVLSVNFQSLGNYANPNSLAGYYIGPIGCLKILGRDPANVGSPYQVIYSRNVDCRFVTQEIEGLGFDGENFEGKGVVTIGEPTLDAAQWGGTGTGLWRPVTLRGGAHVTCPLDLMGWIDHEAIPLPSSEQYARLDRVQPLKHFSMAAFGSISASALATSANPLVTYVPDLGVCGNYNVAIRGCSPTSLSAPFVINSTGHRLHQPTLSSRFNGRTASAAGRSIFSAGPLQYWHTEFNSAGTTTNSAPVIQRRYDMAVDPRNPLPSWGTTVSTLNPGYFRLWTGPTLLYIGKDPAVNKDSFEGTLYEIIVDPSGDSRPQGG